MTDRDDRGNRLSKRFQKDKPDADEDDLDEEKSSLTSNPSNESELSNMSKLSNSSKTEESDRKSVKDRPSVLMYLPDDLHTELDIRFDELNARHKREHGHPIEKNRDYYPAIIEAALENKDIEDVLDL